MTRKQAMMRVCEILNTYEQTEEIEEIQAKMREVMGELPLTGWSEATIFDTIDQWVLENGRAPSTRDLARKGLPPVPVIKNRFQMNARAFLDRYYPKPKPLCSSAHYSGKTKEEWVAGFVEQYKSIRPRSAVEYNQRRAADSPTWATVASICGLQKWNELLTYCQLDKPKPLAVVGRKQTNASFRIHRETDVERVLAKL